MCRLSNTFVIKFLFLTFTLIRIIIFDSFFLYHTIQNNTLFFSWSIVICFSGEQWHRSQRSKLPLLLFFFPIRQSLFYLLKGYKFTHIFVIFQPKRRSARLVNVSRRLMWDEWWHPRLKLSSTKCFFIFIHSPYNFFCFSETRASKGRAEAKGKGRNKFVALFCYFVNVSRLTVY